MTIFITLIGFHYIYYDVLTNIFELERYSVHIINLSIYILLLCIGFFYYLKLGKEYPSLYANLIFKRKLLKITKFNYFLLIIQFYAYKVISTKDLSMKIDVKKIMFRNFNLLFTF